MENQTYEAIKRKYFRCNRLPVSFSGMKSA